MPTPITFNEEAILATENYTKYETSKDVQETYQSGQTSASESSSGTQNKQESTSQSSWLLSMPGLQNVVNRVTNEMNYAGVPGYQLAGLNPTQQAALNVLSQGRNAGQVQSVYGGYDQAMAGLASSLGVSTNQLQSVFNKYGLLNDQTARELGVSTSQLQSVFNKYGSLNDQAARELGVSTSQLQSVFNKYGSLSEQAARELGVNVNQLNSLASQYGVFANTGNQLTNQATGQISSVSNQMANQAAGFTNYGGQQNQINQLAQGYYQSDLVNQQKEQLRSDIQRQLSVGINQLNQQAIGSGNMASSRAGVAEGVMTRGAQESYAKGAASIENEAIQNAYNMAYGQYQQGQANLANNLNAQLSAYQQQQQLGLSTAQAGLAGQGMTQQQIAAIQQAYQGLAQGALGQQASVTAQQAALQNAYNQLQQSSLSQQAGITAEQASLQNTYNQLQQSAFGQQAGITAEQAALQNTYTQLRQAALGQQADLSQILANWGQTDAQTAFNAGLQYQTMTQAEYDVARQNQLLANMPSLSTLQQYLPALSSLATFGQNATGTANTSSSVNGTTNTNQSSTLNNVSEFTSDINGTGPASGSSGRTTAAGAILTGVGAAVGNYITGLF